MLDHRRRARRVIGGIAVDQHVDVGFHVAEHAPHDMALALALFLKDLGTGGTREGGGIIGRVVVVHVNCGGRQRHSEIAHDLGDRNLLIVTRHQDRDFDTIEADGLPYG